MKAPHRFLPAAWRMRPLVAVALLTAFGAGAAETKSKSKADTEEKEACKASLNRIYEAIQEYRRARQDLPAYFSNLEPEFIADPRLFICPEVRRRGDYTSWRSGLKSDAFIDAVVPTTYAYEFCQEPYQLWAGYATTMREYKLRQMQLVGSNVPIVRCLVHQLNLSIGGQLYESVTDWEPKFTNEAVRFEQLLPVEIFRDKAPIPGRFTQDVPPRAPGTDARLLDLSPYYDAAFHRPWLWNNPPRYHLADLPRGVTSLDGMPVAFDVRGLIQLMGRKVRAPFPSRVDGIAVGRACRRIHFLHGAAWQDPLGTKIGHYEFHYADDQRVSLPILYGQDVISAWDAQASPPPNRGLWQGKRARVFHRVWTNPRPEVEIKSVDFCSNLSADSGPFLIAITLEP